MPEDVVDLLLAQHARIEELFRQVMYSDGEQRQERFEELVRLLAVHEAAEEQVVHPRGRTLDDVGDTVVDARLEEEHDAKQMLADLSRDGTNHPQFEERFQALRTAVLMHAKREERYEFPHLTWELDERSRQRLAEAVRAAERLAPTHPHPGTESATANLSAGPPLAMLDRVQDAVREIMDGHRKR
jgi:hemerythrin superfamily protein